MKKYSLLVLFILPILVFGQTENDIKVTGGQKTLELQFSPFGNDPIDINGIRARWFSTDQKAFRLNAFLGINSSSTITQQEDTGVEELRASSSIVIFNIRPGIEKHLTGTSRLSPYFGIEGDIALQISTFKNEFEVAGSGDVEFTKRINDNGFVRVGANLVAGFDYYVAKKLYLGTEFGFGFSFSNGLATKVKSDADGFTEPEPIKGDRSFDLGPNVNAQIRLGYAF